MLISIEVPLYMPRITWKVPGKRLLRAAGTAIRLARNTVMRWRGTADYTRWSSPEGLEMWWVERTRILAELLPASSRVIEFGAGTRQLEKLLPRGCTYIPSDLVDRGPGTLVCDLNRRPLPDLSPVAPEVAVFGGVLEYVRAPEELPQWLAQSGVTTCILSFDPMPAQLSWTARYQETLRRSYYGYMNRLTEAEITRCFTAAAFGCKVRREWKNQVVLQFQKDR